MEDRPLRAVAPEDLKREETDATRLLRGKVVQRVWRHRPEELAIKFEDGTLLYVDAEGGGTQEFSIVGGQESLQDPLDRRREEERNEDHTQS